jgi:hypothetical protein
MTAPYFEHPDMHFGFNGDEPATGFFSPDFDKTVKIIKGPDGSVASFFGVGGKKVMETMAF